MMFRFSALNGLGRASRTFPRRNEAGGAPLPAAVRVQAEKLFGEDFSEVRIFLAPKVRALHARALTMGQQIYFAPGEYAPSTSEGLQLLGHELAHVVQQRASRVRNRFGYGIAVVRDSELEREAERMGHLLAENLARQPSLGTVQLAKDGLREELEDTINKIRELERRIELAFLPPPSSQQYLANRYERLRGALGAIIDRYRPGEGQSDRFLGKLLGALRHPDHLPLLEQTAEALETAYTTALHALGWQPDLSGDGPLKDRLAHVFEQASRAHQKVHFLHVRALINGAPVEALRAAAADEALIEEARTWMTTDDFPAFVTALRVWQRGAVNHLNPVNVDNAIRTELGAWLDKPIRGGVTLAGHVVVLKNQHLKAVRKKYDPAAALPGAGQVNAFTEDGTIFLSASQGEPSTMIHEGIHLYADGVFRHVFGGAIDEGVTEFFARRVSMRSFALPRDKYEKEFQQAANIIRIMTEDVVARAYFGGNIDRMQGEFLRIRTLRGVKNRPEVEADWSAFCRHLANREWPAALALLE